MAAPATQCSTRRHSCARRAAAAARASQVWSCAGRAKTEGRLRALQAAAAEQPCAVARASTAPGPAGATVRAAGRRHVSSSATAGRASCAHTTFAPPPQRHRPRVAHELADARLPAAGARAQLSATAGVAAKQQHEAQPRCCGASVAWRRAAAACSSGATRASPATASGWADTAGGARAASAR